MMSRMSDRKPATQPPMVFIICAAPLTASPIARISSVSWVMLALNASAALPVHFSRALSASVCAVATSLYFSASSLIMSVFCLTALGSPISRSSGSRRKNRWSISHPTPAASRLPSGFNSMPATSKARPTP